MEQENTLGSHSSSSWSHLGEAGIFECDSSAFLQTSKFTGDELTLQQGLFFSLEAKAAMMSTEIGFWRDDSLLESPFLKEESVTENTHHFQNPPGEEAIKFHCHPCLHKTFLQPLENSAPEEILPRRGVLSPPSLPPGVHVGKKNVPAPRQRDCIPDFCWHMTFIEAPTSFLPGSGSKSSST